MSNPQCNNEITWQQAKPNLVQSVSCVQQPAAALLGLDVSLAAAAFEYTTVESLLLYIDKEYNTRPLCWGVLLFNNLYFCENLDYFRHL